MALLPSNAGGPLAAPPDAWCCAAEQPGLGGGAPLCMAPCSSCCRGRRRGGGGGQQRCVPLLPHGGDARRAWGRSRCRAPQITPAPPGWWPDQAAGAPACLGAQLVGSCPAAAHPPRPGQQTQTAPPAPGTPGSPPIPRRRGSRIKGLSCQHHAAVGRRSRPGAAGRKQAGQGTLQLMCASAARDPGSLLHGWRSCWAAESRGSRETSKQRRTIHPQRLSRHARWPLQHTCAPAG
jgi:hypothetical protein